MRSATRSALSVIRAKLGLRRLDPRRLYMVDDGAYAWIGDRGDLTATDARDLRAIDKVGRRPDIVTRDERATYEAADYDAICGRTCCIAAVHGAAGVVKWEALPDTWRDGSVLGPISPL